MPTLKTLAGIRQPPVPAGMEKYPEQVVMVVSAGDQGRPNAMTAGWTMWVSDDPPIVAVAIGKTRYTHGLIQQGRQFVLGYPGADMEAEAVCCGTHTGREVNKFQEAKLATQPARKVKPPLLAKWVAAFECTVTGELDLHSHTIFLGAVQAAHVADKTIPRLYNLDAGPDGVRVFRGLE